MKLCQLIATFADDWLMVVVFAPCAIVAAPADTNPPVGRALGDGCAIIGIGIVQAAHARSAIRRMTRRDIISHP